MPRTDLIAFVDLETTGNDKALDEIIEVGVSLINYPELEEVGAFYRTIQPSNDAFFRMVDKDVVREMHKANGLLDEIVDETGYSIKDTDEKLDLWLDEFTNGEKDHIPLAGSGVSHFDRHYISKFLPAFDKRLTYWAYDVGVLRRMFQLANKTPADELVPNQKTHRALDDARVHADEFRWYLRYLSAMPAWSTPTWEPSFPDGKGNY